MKIKSLLALIFLIATMTRALGGPVAVIDPIIEDTNSIPAERMKAIFEEVKTPFKYGVVLEPPEGKKIDCPNVFRFNNKWYLVYVQLENKPTGYTTQIAESDDLLHWKPRGTIVPNHNTTS